MSEQSEAGADQDEWDSRWVRICEMEVGGHDPLNDFAEEVYSGMAQAGNEVGRPLVMKVTVEVSSGPLKRETEGDSDE